MPTQPNPPGGFMIHHNTACVPGQINNHVSKNLGVLIFLYTQKIKYEYCDF
jgi:hypothetical protein